MEGQRTGEDLHRWAPISLFPFQNCPVPLHSLPQVIKKRLAVCVPMLQSGDSFFYEEADGLDDDEVRHKAGCVCVWGGGGAEDITAGR